MPEIRKLNIATITKWGKCLITNKRCVNKLAVAIPKSEIFPSFDYLLSKAWITNKSEDWSLRIVPSQGKRLYLEAFLLLKAFKNRGCWSTHSTLTNDVPVHSGQEVTFEAHFFDIFLFLQYYTFFNDLIFQPTKKYVVVVLT